MNPRVDPNMNNRCTVIESMHGMVKLIRRTPDGYPTLVTCDFPSLEDCLKYAESNRFEINIIHSGKRRNLEESKNPKGS